MSEVDAMKFGSDKVNRDFTLNKYQEICNTLLTKQYQTITVSEYATDSYDKQKQIAIIRHDVDRRPKHALEMAKLEAELGIKSSYYFRYMPRVYKPKIIKAIRELGHEIGYHYEVLSKTRGNSSKAIKLFQKELNKLRTLADIKTICMHGRPFSPYNNRDLWQHYSMHDFDLIAEPYVNMNFKDVVYFSDTGRTWDNHRYNLRDKLDSLPINETINYSDDLVSFLSKNTQHVFLQTHPERWAYNQKSYVISRAHDFLVNVAKSVLLKVRA